MNPFTVIIIAFGLASVLGAGFGIFLWSRNTGLTRAMSAQRSAATKVEAADNFMRAKEQLVKQKRKTKKKPTEEQLLFQAGVVTADDRKKFQRIKILAPIIFVIVLTYGGSVVAPRFMLLGAVFGVLCGLQLPKSILERKIAARAEDIMFFLPLVIEQIAIGVSSSLDIGPCLQKVVSMADERDSHNVVTELLRLVVTLARSGLSLEDSLLEVGARSGHLELNQTFGSLAQVVRHGGEITKQLQEMADAVSAQRETKIEAKIKRLELEATGPVAMVFMGFLLILLSCIGQQMVKAFN